MYSQRRDELAWAAYGNFRDPDYSFAIEVRRQAARVDAGLNMARTFFICAILGLGSHHISRDSDQLVRARVRGADGRDCFALRMTGEPNAQCAVPFLSD